MSDLSAATPCPRFHAFVWLGLTQSPSLSVPRVPCAPTSSRLTAASCACTWRSAHCLSGSALVSSLVSTSRWVTSNTRACGVIKLRGHRSYDWPWWAGVVWIGVWAQTIGHWLVEPAARPVGWSAVVLLRFDTKTFSEHSSVWDRGTCKCSFWVLGRTWCGADSGGKGRGGEHQSFLPFYYFVIRREMMTARTQVENMALLRSERSSSSYFLHRKNLLTASVWNVRPQCLARVQP